MGVIANYLFSRDKKKRIEVLRKVLKIAVGNNSALIWLVPPGAVFCFQPSEVDEFQVLRCCSRSFTEYDSLLLGGRILTSIMKLGFVSLLPCWPVCSSKLCAMLR